MWVGTRDVRALAFFLESEFALFVVVLVLSSTPILTTLERSSAMSWPLVRSGLLEQI